MDVLGTLTVIVGLAGGVIGAVGGITGLVAFRRSNSDREEARSIAHIPKEVEPLLDELIEIALMIEQRKGHPAHAAGLIAPIREQWKPLAHQAVAAGRGDGRDFARIGVLMEDFFDGLDEDGVVFGPGPVQTTAQQHDTARQLVDAATDLRIWLRTGKRMPERPRDGSDIPPRDTRRFRRVWALTTDRLRT